MFWQTPECSDNGLWQADAFVSYDRVWQLGDAVISSWSTGDRKCLIGLFVDNSVASIAVYVACLRAGHAVYLGDHRTSPAQQRAWLKQYQPDVIWSRRLAFDPGSEFERTPCDHGVSFLYKRPVGPSPHPDLALLLATSGSTGDPKMVRLSHRALAHNADAIAAFLELEAGHCGITSLPISYAYGLSIVNSHLARGASLVCTDQGFFEPEFWRYIDRHRCTSLAGVPWHFEQLHRRDYWRTPRLSLHTYTQAGGPLEPALQRYHGEQAARAGARLFVMYGQTEATARISYIPPDRLLSRVGSIGISIPGGYLSIADADPVTGDGQLVYRGPNVMMGYAYGRTCLHKGDQLGGVLYTGDIARIDDNGDTWLVGRRTRMVKPFGVRISLDHLQTVLSREMRVRVAVVSDNERVTAFVEHDRVAVDELARILKGMPVIPAGSVQILAVPSLPRTERGKIDYQTLATWARTRSTSYISTTSDVHSGIDVTAFENEILAIWADVLGISSAVVSTRRHDSFFDMGGNSLLAIQLLYRLRQHGIKYDISTLFEHPTIAALMANAMQSPMSGAKRLARARPDGRDSEHAPRRLSANQRIHWSFHRRRPATCHLPLMLEISGPLDVTALAHAIVALIQRHAILRTSYRFVAGRLCGQIEPAPATAPLRILNVVDESAIVAEERMQPFQLTAGESLRFTLFQRDGARHALVIVLHHIAGDGWSKRVLVRDLAALYTARVTRTEPMLAPLCGSYADYIARRTRQEQPRARERFYYWRTQLRDMPSHLPLPYDNARPTRLSFRTDTIDFELERRTVTDLNELAAGSRVTLYMTLLAAFHVLLWRVSGQTDIVIGSPHANRSDEHAQALVGCFANTLLIRLQLEPGDTFTSVLDRTKQSVLDGLHHGEVPFEQLAGIRQSGSLYANWFQAMFVLQNLPTLDHQFDGLTVQPVPIASGASNFELTLSLEPRDGRLIGAWTFHIDRFTHGRAALMLAVFRQIVRVVCDSPDVPLDVVTAACKLS